MNTKQNQKAILTIGAVVLKEDHVLLVRHTERAGHITGVYGLPAGKVEDGEEPVDACVRELQEETGLKPDRANLWRLAQPFHAHIHMKYGLRHFNWIVFLVTEWERELSKTAKEEAEWVPVSKLDSYPLLPNVSDATVSASLLKSRYPDKTWISSKVSRKPSMLGGDGLFAIQDIFENEGVVVWGSDYTDDERRIEEEKSHGKLVMQWDSNIWSIEDRQSDEGYFINHSCDPNVWMIDSFTLIARRSIQAGEEITADYVFWEADEQYISSWECSCGSPLCRGRVSGLDWQNRVLQQRYTNHFSPLINKRIKHSIL